MEELLQYTFITCVLWSENVMLSVTSAVVYMCISELLPRNLIFLLGRSSSYIKVRFVHHSHQIKVAEMTCYIFYFS